MTLFSGRKDFFKRRFSWNLVQNAICLDVIQHFKLGGIMEDRPRTSQNRRIESEGWKWNDRSERIEIHG